MVTYTTAAKVAELLQIPAFSGSTTPTATQVESFITRKESLIEGDSGHAWQTLTVTKEYVEPTGNYEYGTGIRFDLAHRSLTTFASGTDKIEVWDGSNWVDWVATKSQGRGDDFWVDEVNGVVYLMTRSTVYRKGVRITYRYGEASVPGNIEELATKMAAIDVLIAYEKNLVFADDGGTHRPSVRERVEAWREDIKGIQANIKEYEVA